MARTQPWLKPVVGVVAFVPAAGTAFRFFTGKLGANPIAEALNELGLWTLILLMTTLACTPLKIIFDWNWPLRLRRTLGLCTFAYVCMHFLTYLVVDQYFDWGEIWKDIAKRKFITVGFAAFVLMIPLAVTSTNKMVKRLGVARWKALHRLVYVIGVLGIVHFIWRVKADLRTPLAYACVLAVLLLVRVVASLRGGRRPSPS
jgi:sulfoxide reductase heme-binding subunit YedZ